LGVHRRIRLRLVGPQLVRAVIFLRIKQYGWAGELRHLPCQLGLRDQRLRAFELLLQPCRRIIGIERHIGPAGFQDSEHRHQHRCRAIKAESDARVRSDSLLAQIMRQLIRPLIEFAVRECLLAAAHRHAIGNARCLLLEKLMQAFVRGIGRCRLVPLEQQLPPFIFRQQRQMRHWGCRTGQCRRQQVLVIAGNALDRATLEACRIVVKFEPQFRSPPHHVQPQLETLAHHLHPFQAEAHAPGVLCRPEISERKC
jgi:hypothetical protein